MAFKFWKLQMAVGVTEGSAGHSNPGQKKFIGYAQRSAIEVVGCLYIDKKGFGNQ